MNEESGGTPNPYNPNSGTYPNGGIYSSDGGYGNDGYQNMGGYPGTNGYPTTGGYQGATGYQNTAGYQNTNGYQNPSYGYGNSGWPSNQPAYSNEPIMLAPSGPEPNKKKKAGLVVAALAVVLILVGVLALVTMLPSGQGPKDPVSAAISRLLSENAPEGVAINGRANLATDDNKAFIQNAELKVKSELMIDSLISSTVVGLNAELGTGGNIALKLSENYSGESGVFIKVDGVAVSLQNQATPADEKQTNNKRANQAREKEEIEVSEEYLKCLSDIDSGENCKDLLDDGTAEADNMTNLAMLTTMLQALSGIDGEWIRIPVSELGNSVTSDLTNDNMGQCVVGLAGNIRESRQGLGQLYNDNEFVYSRLVTEDDDELSDLDRQAVSALLASNDEDADDENTEEGADGEEPAESLIRQVMFDEETLKNFVGVAAEASGEVKACLSGEDAEASAEEIVELVKNLPSIFVTLDDSLNFTKIYFAFMMDAKTSVVAGIDLAYPDNITVVKPGDYKDLSAVMQDLSENQNN